MKKLLMAIAAVFIMCFFSGCVDEFAGVDELMSPPTINDDQYGIYKILRSDSAVPDFVYPVRGSMTNPIYVGDIDGDGRNEGFAFCLDTESGGSSITFMEESDGSWNVCERYLNSANQVDKVIMEDITGDGIPEIIVGWGAYRSMAATVCIYKYTGSQAVEEHSLGYTYGDMMITDFTGDGLFELCTVKTHSTGEDQRSVTSNAVARVYTFNSEKPYCIYSVSLSKEVKEYVNFSFGSSDTGGSMLVIDGVTADGDILTQVLVLSSDSSGIIRPLLYSDMQRLYDNFRRPSELPVTAVDIDGDGHLELPFAVRMMGLSGSSPNEYTVYWMNYLGTDRYFEPVAATVTNVDMGFYMTVDLGMKNVVAVSYPEERRYMLNIAKSDDISQAMEFSTLFTVQEFDGGRVTLREIQKEYDVLEVCDDGSIIAVKYSSSFENEEWVRDIAQSYRPLSDITY